jgi:hypothetical protein
VSRTDAIAKRFAEWSDGGTLPSPQHAKDVQWLIEEHERMEQLLRSYKEMLGKRDQLIRSLQGAVDSLTALGANK